VRVSVGQISGVAQHGPIQDSARARQFETHSRPVIAIWTGAHTMAVKRRDRLGGLLHEYERAA